MLAVWISSDQLWLFQFLSTKLTRYWCKCQDALWNLILKENQRLNLDRDRNPAARDGLILIARQTCLHACVSLTSELENHSSKSFIPISAQPTCSEPKWRSVSTRATKRRRSTNSWYDAIDQLNAEQTTNEAIHVTDAIGRHLDKHAVYKAINLHVDGVLCGCSLFNQVKYNCFSSDFKRENQ